MGSMMGVEYRNWRGEETSAYSTDILKFHDILINIITSLKTYWQTIDQGANLVHCTIGAMSFLQ